MRERQRKCWKWNWLSFLAMKMRRRRIAIRGSLWGNRCSKSFQVLDLGKPIKTDFVPHGIHSTWKTLSLSATSLSFSPVKKSSHIFSRLLCIFHVLGRARNSEDLSTLAMDGSCAGCGLTSQLKLENLLQKIVLAVRLASVRPLGWKGERPQECSNSKTAESSK